MDFDVHKKGPQPLSADVKLGLVSISKEGKIISFCISKECLALSL